MLTRIELINFQAHKSSSLELGKMTVLTGGSNSGKSSVLRALAGVLRNDSAGDFITHGEKKLCVKLHFDTGHVVEWYKGSGDNHYTVIDPDGEKHDYHKVGADVPEEVAEVMKLTPLLMEGGSKLHINLHEQLEAPFLVTREHTAGFAAKVFGELTSAAKIQAAVAEGNKLARAASVARKAKKEDLILLREELSEFDSLAIDQLLYAEAERSFLSAEAVQTEIDLLSSWADDYEASVEKAKKLENIIPALEEAARLDLDALVKVGEDENYLRTSLEKLTSSIIKAGKLEKLIPVLEECSQLPQVDETQAFHKKICDLSWWTHQFDDVEDKVEAAESAVEGLTKSLTETEKQLEDLYPQLESCPSCGQELGDDAKAHLLGESLVW